MEAFRRTRGGGARASFAPPEAALLRGLVDQVAALVGGAQETPDARAGEVSGPDPRELDKLFGFTGADDPAGPATPPDDPALARLLPDGYRDDPEAAGEFRKYTEQSLRSAKHESARTVLDTLPAEGGAVRLTGDQAQDWLRTLNDVRLTLGVRLEVTEEFEQQWAKLPPDDPRSAAFEVYDWLGSVQESLIQALM